MVKINSTNRRTIAIVGLFAFVCLIIAFVPAPVTSGDWAAWIEGFGAVAAVGLVTWIRPPPPLAAVDTQAQEERQAAARRAEQLDQAVSSLHRAATDLELAIWDGDFRRVRDGVALVSEGRATASLDQLLQGPAWAWPNPGLRSRAQEVKKAILDLARLLPEPEPGPDSDEALTAWWESLKTAVARLRLVASRLLKEMGGGERA